MKNKYVAGVSVAALMACMAVSLTGCTSQKEELNLYTWDGMFPQEVLDGFEQETGYRINYTNFAYDEDMLARLEETKGADYDVVIADDYILESVIAEGLAAQLDTAKISTYENINPFYQGMFYDEKDEYTIPYGAGIPLIVYDPEKVGFEITGYEDLWDERLEDNLALIGNYRVIEGIVLKTMGESFNTQDLDVIAAAGEKLLQLAPNVRVISDSNTQDYLLNGEVSVAFMYTSQVVTALMQNPDLQVVYPKEGIGLGVMAAFIPSQAPHTEAAYAFLEYINQPENAAKCFEHICYFCTNKAAESYISEAMKEAIILPDDMSEGEIIQNVSQEAEDLHAKNWDNFKVACD